ncbi:MAG: Gfo/Idh/MocA family protein, partial [Thermoprotei archaeon]
KILEEVKKNKVLTSVGYMNRYRKSVNYAREAFAQDPPSLILGGWVHGLPGIYWNMTKAKSGSPLHEQVTHSVDEGRYFAGDVELVSAFGARGFNKNTPSYYDIDDANVLNVKFKSGAVGNFYLSNASNAHGGVFMSVYAYDTAAIFDGWEQNLTLYRERGSVTVTIKGEPDIFKIEDRAFFDAVKANDSSLVKSDYEDALKTAAVTLAGLSSLETGGPVKVPEVQ